jgi:hypothetical protein
LFWSSKSKVTKEIRKKEKEKEKKERTGLTGPIGLTGLTGLRSPAGQPIQLPPLSLYFFLSLIYSWVEIFKPI